ncbi:MAG: hypothetical protein M9927_11425 [Anaerolineae bacterium]|nr:hypothetical protein [Anaerolineae bacterium]
MQGWALTEQESVEQGVALMEQSLADFRAVQAGLRRPYYLGLLAEAYGQVGRIEDGLRLTDEALARAHRQQQLAYEPDVHRVQGELLRRSGAAAQEVETCFQRAIKTASRRPGSRSCGQQQAWRALWGTGQPSRSPATPNRNGCLVQRGA